MHRHVPIGAHPAIANFLIATGVGVTGKTTYIEVKGVTTDSAGYVYVVGAFGGAGSTAQFGTHKITSATREAIFVAKFSPAATSPFGGTWLWAKAIDPGGPSSIYGGWGIVIDGLGRVDIVGTLTTSPQSSRSILVAQLNGINGNIFWTHLYKGGQGFGITTQPPTSPATRGSLLDITGYIQGAVNFAGPVKSVGPNDDLFVGQLTEAGTPVWGRALPQPTFADSGGTGITFDPAKGVISAVGTLQTSPSASTLLVGEYTSAGVFIQSKSYPGFAPSSRSTGISVDGLQHLYVTGWSSTAQFVANGAIVAKLDETSLAPLWSQDFLPGGPTRSAAASGVAVDKLGEPFITGTFSGTINFGGPPLTSVAGSYDVFVAKLKPSNGLATWSVSAGGPGNDQGIGIAFDLPTISQVYIVGDYQPLASFGPIVLAGNGGSENIFLASLQ
jgi:hypothetical protein